MVEPRGATSNSPGDPLGQGRELRDAREQLGATREILVALGRSGADPGAILDTVVERAARLCGAQVGQLYLREGDVFRLSRVSGKMPEAFRRYLEDHPVALNRLSSVGRAALDRRTHQIADVLNDPDYGRQDLQRLGGYRTLLSAPMILDDEVVGVLSMWRTELAPFDDREVELLEAFAVQGAIVLRQVDLVHALESRRAELASKVDAARGAAGGRRGGQLEPRPRRGPAADRHATPSASRAPTAARSWSTTTRRTAFRVRTAYGSSRELLERLRAITIHRESTLVGRTAMERRPLEVPDLAETELDPHLEILFRRRLALPARRADAPGRPDVGALVIRRRTPGAFDDEMFELLRTFASQSALAIVNARLFRELETKTARARGRQPAQVGVPGQHVARAAHPAERRDRLLRGAARPDVRRAQRAPGRVPPRHLELRAGTCSSSSTRSSTCPRSRPARWCSSRPRSACGGALEYALSLVRERAAAHAHHARPRGRRRRRAVIEADELRLQAGGAQPRVERGQVHPGRRHASTVRAGRDGDELAGRGHRHRHRRRRPRTGSGSSSRSSRAAAARRRRRAPASA